MTPRIHVLFLLLILNNYNKESGLLFKD